MTEIFFFVLLYLCFFLKIFVNLPRHERDEVLTRSCGCLVTFVLRSHQLRVEVFLFKSSEKTHQSPILRKLIVSRISFSMKFSSHPAISLFLPIGIFFSFLLSTAVTIFVIIE